MTQNSNLKAFHYDLVVMAEDHRQADRVVTERVGYDEDLRETGVGDYSIDANPVGGRKFDPVDPAEDAAEQKRLTSLVRNPSDIRGVSEDQFYSFARINTVLGGGTLPMAAMVDARAGETGPVLTILYRHDGNLIRLRLDADGSLSSMETEWGDDWLDMEGGPLHALIVDALNVTVVG